MRRSVLFVIDVFKYGGAQRVLLHYANLLSARGFRVSIFSIKDDRDFPIPAHIKYYSALRKEQKITENIFCVLEILGRAVKCHDIIVGFMDFIANYLTVLSSMINDKPFVVSSRNTLSAVLNDFEFKEINHDLITHSYNLARKIVCPSHSVASDLIEHFSIEREKTVVLYNPVDIRLITSLKEEKLAPEHNNMFTGKTLLSIGRLERQKNHAALIHVFKDLVNDCDSDLTLVIIGEGGLRHELEKLIYDLGINKKVFLIGMQDNVYKFINQADIFVLPSLYEGLPNVILEAMAVGVPVVASRLPSTEEIVTESINGLLYDKDDTQEMREKIVLLLRDSEMGDRLVLHALNDIKIYDIDKVEEQLIRLLEV